jgi:hypothetical protein
MHTVAAESVYQRVAQGEWDTLDPRLRAYFGPAPSGTVGVGRGIFEFAGSRMRVLRLVFALTTRSGILFPEVGRDVPFTVINAPEPDGSLTATRTFAFPNRVRVMRDTLVVHDGRLELTLGVTVVDGGMRLESRRLGLRLGSLRLPLPAFTRVTVDACADGAGQRVDVRMQSPFIGEIFRYTGTFTYEHVPPR